MPGDWWRVYPPGWRGEGGCSGGGGGVVGRGWIDSRAHALCLPPPGVTPTSSVGGLYREGATRRYLFVYLLVYLFYLTIYSFTYISWMTIFPQAIFWFLGVCLCVFLHRDGRRCGLILSLELCFWILIYGNSPGCKLMFYRFFKIESRYIVEYMFASPNSFRVVVDVMFIWQCRFYEL